MAILIKDSRAKNITRGDKEGYNDKGPIHHKDNNPECVCI